MGQFWFLNWKWNWNCYMVSSIVLFRVPIAPRLNLLKLTSESELDLDSKINDWDWKWSCQNLPITSTGMDLTDQLSFYFHRASKIFVAIFHPRTQKLLLMHEHWNKCLWQGKDAVRLPQWTWNVQNSLYKITIHLSIYSLIYLVKLLTGQCRQHY